MKEQIEGLVSKEEKDGRTKAVLIDSTYIDLFILSKFEGKRVRVTIEEVD